MNSSLKGNDRVLIVLMGSVGDVVRALPVASALKEFLSEGQLGWVVESKSFGIVKDHPAIDQLFLFKRENGISAALNVIKEIRASGYNVVFDLQRHFKSGVFTFFSGAKRRIGFNRANAKEFNWLFQTEQIEAQAQTFPKIQHYLKFLDLVNVPAPAQLNFGLQGKAQVPLSTKLPANYFLLVLGSSWESKDWPAEGYAKLVKLVLESGQGEIVLSGGNKEKALAEELARISPRIVNLVGQTSLEQLIAVISKARVCVGPDSGPAHIAAALNVKYVSLFGPTDPQRVAAYGMEPYVIRSAVGCSPCNRKVCPGLNKICMRLISAERVWEVMSSV